MPIAPGHHILPTLLYGRDHPLRLEHGGSVSCRTLLVLDTYSLPSPTYLIFHIHLDIFPYAGLPYITDCSRDVNPNTSLHLLSSSPQTGEWLPLHSLSFTALMASRDESVEVRYQPDTDAENVPGTNSSPNSRWQRMLGRSNTGQAAVVPRESSETSEDMKCRPKKWSLGILNDKETDEVPGIAALPALIICKVTDNLFVKVLSS